MAVAEVFSYLGDHPGILIVLGLLYCFIYALSVMFSGPKPGKNPFAVKHVKPPKPLVTDHSLRNKVLKQRFKAHKVPEDLDDIIIGSGIGGLSTGVFLSRAGHKVLVLEQHDQAGGCCHTFLDKGYEFDTGIHYVGKMMDGDSTRVLTDQITEGQVVWEPMDPVYDWVAVGPSEKAKFYSMMSGSNEKFAENLKRQFPSEKDAVDKLMNLLKECRSCTRDMFIPKVLPLRIVNLVIKSGLFSLLTRKFSRLSKLSLKDALDEMTDNKEFKSVCSYIFGDMGALPSDMSVLCYSMLVGHYIPGSFYPRGGTSEIAFQIIPIIERYGGRVLVDAPVTKILVNEKGRACGVTVHKASGDVNIHAKRIISDAGVMNTFKYLLPREIAVRAPLFKYIDKVGPSISNLTVFVGLNATAEEVGMTTGNTWAIAGTDLEQTMRDYFALSAEEAADSDAPALFVSFPSAKDSSWASRYPGKSVVLVIALTPWSWFSEWKDGKVKHRGDEYNSIKERIGRQMWKQTEQLFPKLEGKMEYIDVGTPLSNSYYLGQPEGEMYGLDHGMTRFYPEISMHLRPESGVPGLYLTGQDIVTAGFSGAMFAGLLTSGAILHRRLDNDLAAVVKETRKNDMGKKVQ